MSYRSFRRGVAALALGVILGACQLSVGIDTTVDPTGAGTVALRMGMDEELVTTARADLAEMSAFDSLFEELGERGWEVTKTQPDGGLVMLAERVFEDGAGHRTAMKELQTVLRSNPSELIGDLRFDLNLRANKGLFQTRARFEGSIDTTSGVKLDPHLLSAVEDLVRFEVGVTLPGEATVGGGEASAEGTRIVWRPSLGEKVKFAASSEAMRLGPMFFALFAALALLAAAIGSLVSRRRRASEVRSGTTVRSDEPPPVLVLEQHRRALPDQDVVLTAKPIDVEALLGGSGTPRRDDERSIGAPSSRRP